MRFISTYTHGIMDYFVAAMLVTAPWMFGFVRGGAETWVFVAVGLLTVLYSLLTDYELGAFRIIPMPFHLALDFFAGVFLILSPWLLGFSHHSWIPHVCFGTFEILVAPFSQIIPGPRTGRPDHIPLR